ncbi:segregation/condensation protein A [Vulcanibacillus modesticaldus]|uniref:Segregation and condensation protein A n=1 Tax=Vulcanibacillus modesticaldus TaxID=337097 RepID=A0A1D2YSH5_9BACI|nr:segregation/condensation protein A [Vulcanibacillus modesticaldus]OEF97246.1 segregation/condensation protein A [Vulcanibacillus modesticaldus]
MSYEIKLDFFEGPLDLLLHLIDKEEMDIYDIQIAKITDQYLQYIRTMQTLKLDVTSDFLVMAATLLAIKSKMLLPNYPKDMEPMLEMDDYYEEDPREELVKRLIEYKKFKQLSSELREREIERSKIFTRSPQDLTPYIVHEEENPVQGISLYHLVDAYEKVLSNYSYNEPLTTLEREEISVKDKIDSIVQILKEKRGIVRFSELLHHQNSKSEIVATFLSILELMKQKLIICIQNQLFDEIVIYYSTNEGVEKDGL